MSNGDAGVPKRVTKHVTKIAIVGGTGREGVGLALRWTRAGHTVVIGSRDAERAKTSAQTLTNAGLGLITGGSNADAIEGADVVVLAIPYSAHTDTLLALKPLLRGQTLLDITVPLQPPKVTQVHIPPGMSAALETQELLGPDTPVVAALHHISSTHLANPSHVIDCDVLVCADNDTARTQILALIEDLGLRALDAGPLRNSIALEALTPILLQLGRKYKSPGAGIRITGVVAPTPPTPSGA